MLLEIIVAIICAVLPILAYWLSKKIDRLVGEGELAKVAVQLMERELKEAYDEVFEDIKKYSKDGKITKEEKNALIEKLKAKAKESKMEIIEAMAPKVYEYAVMELLKKVK